MKIVFWQKEPSIHQSALINNLSNTPGINVTLICESSLRSKRIKDGWPSMPNFGKAKLIISPTIKEIESIIQDQNENSFNIFSGIYPIQLVRKALYLAIKNKKSYIIIQAEKPRYSYSFLFGTIKFIKNKLESFLYRDRIDLFLAIGADAKEWYAKCGYPKAKIAEYAYFTEPPMLMDFDDSKRGPTKIIFIGHLEKRKNILILIRALVVISKYNTNWSLVVIGDGPLREKANTLCLKGRIHENVKFLGTLSNNEAMKILSESDVLVLPSKYDGWGAVCSEALMRGIPVICSNRCGSLVLLNSTLRKLVFRNNSVNDLVNKINYFVSNQEDFRIQRLKIAVEYSTKIGPSSASFYLLSLLKAIQNKDDRIPSPPWSIDGT